MPVQTVLIVDTDPGVREMLSQALASPGRTVYPAENAHAALAIVARVAPDLLITDLELSGSQTNGFELLEILRDRRCDLDVIVTASASFLEQDTFTRAKRAGALHVLRRPLDLDRVRSCVDRALKVRRLRERHRRRARAPEAEAAPRLVGTSEPLLELKERVAECAMTDVDVLLTGETGTGKELVARTIHEQSGRSDRPFVAANCAAVAATLVESELFGHSKGSFTGAVEEKKGLFAMAGGGTVLLDEIGEAPMEFQAKLLRVLQERRFVPVGGETEEHMTARVIAATNRNLGELARKKSFRRDLFHRLNVVTIRVPTLRERIDDLDELVPHLLGRAALDMGIELVPYVSDEAMDVMRLYPWLGNVRELEHALRRALVSARTSGVILPEDLGLDTAPEAVSLVRPASNTSTDDAPGFGERLGDGRSLWIGADGRFLTWAEGRREHIQEALRRSGGNVSEAARLLGVKRSTLQDWMNKLGITATP